MTYGYLVSYYALNPHMCTDTTGASPRLLAGLSIARSAVEQLIGEPHLPAFTQIRINEQIIPPRCYDS